MVQWVVESIPHSGPIELFPIPARAPCGICCPVGGMLHIKVPGC